MPPHARIAYTVSATFPDKRARADWVSWLQDGHVDQVIAHGAHSATIVLMERQSPADPPRAEARYVFSTRELFDAYIARHAPALRAEGLKRFPPESGVTISRSVGTIV